MAYTPAVLVWGIIPAVFALGNPDIHLFTDVLGSWGCGALASPFWLQVGWPTGNYSIINCPEGAGYSNPCIGSVGSPWSGKLVVCHSDNMTVVAQLNSLHARDPLASNMLRCIALLQAQFGFCLRPAHIPGLRNVGADHLSRGRAQAFLELCPSFSHFPSQVPTSSS